MYGFSTQNLNFEETREQNLSTIDCYVGLWCLTPLSTIFHLYRDGYVYVLGMKLIRFINLFYLFIFGVLTPLSTIFQLYHGDQF